jgi:hypothetical protein
LRQRIGFGLLIGTLTAIVSGGRHEWLVHSLIVSLAATFVLLMAGSILRPFPRTRRAGELFVTLGIATLIAIPVTHIAARGVVKIDLWRAQRYVETRLGPDLDHARALTGRYPAHLDLFERAPKDAPRMIGWFDYGSDGKTYVLSVMDPMICGRVTSYRSTTRQWRETYDPCWY